MIKPAGSQSIVGHPGPGQYCSPQLLVLPAPLWAAGIYSSRESWDHSSVISVSRFTAGKKHKVSSQCCMISGDPARVQHKGPGKPGEKSAHRFWLRCLNADSGMFLHGQATSPGFRASSRAGIRETSSSKQQSKMVTKWSCLVVLQYLAILWSSWSTEALAEVEKTGVSTNLEEHHDALICRFQLTAERPKASAICDHTNS